MSGVGFALSGCGMIASLHAAAIEALPGARLVGVQDALPDCAAAFAQRHGCKAYATLEELLADGEVQVVNVCTPSGLHAATAVAAAQAGKHVVVEKPMALTLADADAVVKAGDENGVLICVVSQLRLSPAVAGLRRAVREGKLGRMVMADLDMKYHRDAAYYAAGGGWRGTWAMDGGGALMNQGIHGVDLLCHICGPVKRVSARAATLVQPIEVEDTVCALLEYEDGALGTLAATTAATPGYGRRLTVCGDKGSAVLEEDLVARWDLDAPRPEAAPTSGGAASDPAAIGYAGHLRQFQNLLAAMRGEEALLVDARQGRIPVALILAVYESARTGTPQSPA